MHNEPCIFPSMENALASFASNVQTSEFLEFYSPDANKLAAVAIGISDTAHHYVKQNNPPALNSLNV